MRLVAKLAALGAALAVVLTAACAGAAAGSETKPEHTIGVRHSKFDQAIVRVHVGEAVTFTLRNFDPIEHEWIVGSADVHERHRTGTEPNHDEVATEVTMPAFSTRTTTVSFDKPGDYPFICHLPGHEAYGMKGIVRVTAP